MERPGENSTTNQRLRRWLAVRAIHINLAFRPKAMKHEGECYVMGDIQRPMRPTFLDDGIANIAPILD
jgi:hypothetical protein